MALKPLFALNSSCASKRLSAILPCPPEDELCTKKRRSTLALVGRIVSWCQNRVPTFRLTRLFVSPDFSLRTTGYTPMHALTGMPMAAVAAAASSKWAAEMLHQITSTKPAGQCEWLWGFCHCICSGLVSGNWRITGYLQQNRYEGISSLLLWRWQDEAVSICRGTWEATPCHEITAVLSIWILCKL